MTKTLLTKISDFYIKREDQNITGSAKDRALLVQTQYLLDKGIHKAVISSTGNAAISALYFCQKLGIDLTIFISPKINPSKKALINQANIIISPNPIKDAFQYSKNNNAFFLRQSTDPNALLGYNQIAVEILEQLPQISSLFVPVGSGTTLLGIRHIIPSSIPIYAVQPASYCPIASNYDKNYFPESYNLTDALSVKYLPLKKILLKQISDAFVTQNDQILQSQKILQNLSIITSNEGALAHAGLEKARKLGKPVGNFPVVLLTGAKR